MYRNWYVSHEIITVVNKLSQKYQGYYFHERSRRRSLQTTVTRDEKLAGADLGGILASSAPEERANLPGGASGGVANPLDPPFLCSLPHPNLVASVARKLFSLFGSVEVSSLGSLPPGSAPAGMHPSYPNPNWKFCHEFCGWHKGVDTRRRVRANSWGSHQLQLWWEHTQCQRAWLLPPISLRIWLHVSAHVQRVDISPCSNNIHLVLKCGRKRCANWPWFRTLGGCDLLVSVRVLQRTECSLHSPCGKSSLYA